MDDMTAAQAAILTGVSERTIRRKIASGVIPARRLGRNRFAIKVSDLHASHPFESLTLRVEALEQRLGRLEAELQVPSEAAQPGVQLDGSVELTFWSSAEVQHLLAQLAYETARLARNIPSPQGPQVTVSPLDEQVLPNRPIPSRPRKRRNQKTHQ
jgi:excisionase family DNA binding protein